MGNDELTAKTIAERLEAGAPIVLASIIGLQGSSPRHGGAKMVVARDGAVYGTIGGSLMEAAAITASRLALEAEDSKVVDFNLDGVDAKAKGMICGGTASILLDLVPATKENVQFFRGYHDLLVRGRDFYFLTVYKADGNRALISGHSLLLNDGTASGTYPWSEDELEVLKSELHNVSSTSVLTIGDSKVVIDPIRKTKTVYCFGAGHVAVPTAHVAALAGFRVAVIDDRADFANAERFPEAATVVVTRDFGRALEELPINRDSFVVIVTRGHRYDRVVLEQALNTDAGYIGMIGSVRKRDAIYSALLEDGMAPEELKRVHCPIGTSIQAETPEEIAVSIVSEMIAERARLQK